MKTTASDALICVDVQNDFCFGGALPVPQGEHVSGPLNRAILKFETIVLTRDWHPADHCSFSDAPTYADGSWPPHCVQNSPGAEFHGELHAPLDAILISKGDHADREAYSGFQDTGLAEKLRAGGRLVRFDFCLASDTNSLRSRDQSDVISQPPSIPLQEPRGSFLYAPRRLKSTSRAVISACEKRRGSS